MRIESDVPPAWGCGSSTTDVLSTVRAVADAFGTDAGAGLDRPAGGGGRDRLGLADVRAGPRRALCPAPRQPAARPGRAPARVRVLGFNTDGYGGLETLKLPPVPVLRLGGRGVPGPAGAASPRGGAQDPQLLGRVATASTMINQRHRPKRLMPELLRMPEGRRRAWGRRWRTAAPWPAFSSSPAAARTPHGARARPAAPRAAWSATWEFSTDCPPSRRRSVSGAVINANFVDAIALPRIVWLRPNLIGLAFPLMKLLPARFIIRKALEVGELRPGGLIAETTSGTFGLALAMVARLRRASPDAGERPGHRRRRCCGGWRTWAPPCTSCARRAPPAASRRRGWSCWSGCWRRTPAASARGSTTTPTTRRATPPAPSSWRTRPGPSTA